MFRAKLHKDGSLSVWDELTQQWKRYVPESHCQPSPPIAPAAGTWRPPVQTIERTGKGCKLAMLVGGMIMVSSFAVFAVAATSSSREGGPVYGVAGVLMFMAGLFIYMVARLLAWWNHG